MLIDTHAHLNFNAFKDDADEATKRSLKENIWMINVGSQHSTSERAVLMAEKYSEGVCPHTKDILDKAEDKIISNGNIDRGFGVGVYAAIGIHPIHLSELVFKDKVDEDEEVEFNPSVEDFDEEKYLKLAESKKVVAIGEIGLDYFHISKSKIKNQKSKLQFKNQNLDGIVQELKDKQKKVFIKQIDFAIKLDLPVIIHCREAHDDVIEILRGKKKQFGKKLRGVVHCFSGRLTQAKIYTEELGFHLGFNGIITFDRSYDKVVREIDLRYILTETDCPYLTPIPFRGKRNEPLYVKYVAEKIAEIKNIDLAEVENITTESAKKLFGI